MSFHEYDIKLGALVEEVPEGSPPSPPPPARSPSGRLREKIARDSSISVSKGQSSPSPAAISPATSSSSGGKEVLEVVSTDDVTDATPPRLVSTGIDNELENDMKEKSRFDSSNQVPVSANIDKKMADLPNVDGRNDRSLQLAQRGFHLDVSNSPEAESSRPGAFSVAGIGQQNNEDAAPSVPSIVMDVEDLPIAAELADEGKPVEASKLEDVVVNYRSRKVRIGLFVLILVLTGAIIGGILGAQKRKEDALGECIVEDPTKLGNGQCDGDEYNTEKCQWDMSDCLTINEYPDCALTPEQSAKLGNGYCDGLPWFKKECGYDAGDCTECIEIVRRNDMADHVGNGDCDGGNYNTAECNWDGGDCLDFNQQYPDCRAMNTDEIGDGECDDYNDSNTAECGWDGGDCIIDDYPDCHVDPYYFGNGECNEGDYNTEKCGWDGGDCIVDGYPKCHVDPYYFGNGECNGGDYNTEKCGWDGGDCIEFNEKIGILCRAARPFQVGDGVCNGGEYNTPECKWDGGDCVEFNRRYPFCRVEYPSNIGDDKCDGGLLPGVGYTARYNSAECGWDGGDCPVLGYPLCHVDLPDFIGNDDCNGGQYNTFECGWDGGDCLDFNLQYPNCQILYASWIGDRQCDMDANNADCGWDGGDCLEFNDMYPGCRVDYIGNIGDGQYNGGAYNTLECDWDGGDCSFVNELLWEAYPDCKGGVDPSEVGDGYCDGGVSNSADCGWDGGDCVDFNSLYPDCSVDYPGYIGDGSCDDYSNYNTAQCGWDGGDCEEKTYYTDCHVEHADYVGDGQCDGGAYNTEECRWDGGDCKIFNGKFPRLSPWRSILYLIQHHVSWLSSITS